MMRDNALEFITGLHRENSHALGFIPTATIRDRYLRHGQYVLQHDERGRPVGFLLHGPIRPGADIVISQHCIDADKRLRGYGEQAFNEVLERGTVRNARAIRLRCATNLAAVEFWQAMGFAIVGTKYPPNSRNRAIYEMRRDLWVPLWSEA